MTFEEVGVKIEEKKIEEEEKEEEAPAKVLIIRNEDDSSEEEKKTSHRHRSHRSRQTEEKKVEEEKKVDQPQDKRAQARAALTELFQSIRTEETPVVVENVVNDIDNEVVNIVRQFNDAFKSITAQREIKKKLRSILWIKYSIKDNDVFEKAYQYIEMYY